ncbi:MAG: glycosyltransferase family 4 protein [Tissierellia bacterium]|nr:glycosyltransferase family 4 protein [Tissierellia bacterium]
MKVLFFIDNFGSGGAQRQIVNLALLFHERGHHVRFLTYGKGDFFINPLRKAQITVDSIDSSGPIDRILKVRKYIRSGTQDVVISFLETPNFLACLSAVGGRRWQLITNERSAKVTSFTKFKGRLYKWFERYSDQIVCNSNNAKNLWERYYPRYKHKIITIYNPVLISEEINSVKLNKDGKIHMVVAASYQYLKNMNGLIEAVNMLSDVEKSMLQIDWYGRIEVTSGNTKAYEEAITKIQEYKLNNISLNETTPEIISIMSNSDFVCLFSKVEGLPNVICEGMILGKPIIMSKVSDYDILVNKENGFLCDAEDPVSIKEALLKAINLSKEEISLMGENSRKKADKLFNKNTIIEQWLNLINSIEKR